MCFHPVETTRSSGNANFADWFGCASCEKFVEWRDWRCVASFHDWFRAEIGIEEGSGGWATRTTFHKLKSPQVIIFLERPSHWARCPETCHPASLFDAFANEPACPSVRLLEIGIEGMQGGCECSSVKEASFLPWWGGYCQKGCRRYWHWNPSTTIRNAKFETNRYWKEIVGEDREGRKLKSQSAIQSNQLPVTLTCDIFDTKISALYPSQRVLTDHRNHRIDTFLFHSQSAQKVH